MNIYKHVEYFDIIQESVKVVAPWKENYITGSRGKWGTFWLSTLWNLLDFILSVFIIKAKGRIHSTC